MSDRLRLINSLIIPAETIADVGCDHGKVAEYVVSSGIAGRVIASDISEKCLQKARARLQNASNVEFVCCDGIKYICDEAVISGMGGIVIDGILRSCAKLPKTLILSPHRDAALIRRTLIELGYGIDRDVPLFDRNKFYYVIRADKTCGVRQLSEEQIKFGVDCAKQSDALKKRLIQLYKTYSVAPEANAQALDDVKAVMQLQQINFIE